MTGYNVRLTREQLRLMRSLADEASRMAALNASRLAEHGEKQMAEEARHLSQVARGITDRIKTALKQPLKGESNG